MQPRHLQWITASIGLVFLGLGIAAFLRQFHADGAIWFLLGAVLILLGSADQHRPLARWRVMFVCLLPMIGVVIGMLHLTGHLP